MGRLCRSYNDMRASLEQNNRKMWRFVEERRRLNASFSHDLRTPLTVLRGYTDMLRKYIPVDRYPKEKLISTVNTMSDHINRLENYVSAMNTLYRLEDITVDPGPVEGEKLAATLRSTAEILCREADMRLQFNACLDGILQVDAEVVMQVFENMMSNAVRFASGLHSGGLFPRRAGARSSSSRSMAKAFCRRTCARPPRRTTGAAPRKRTRISGWA